VDHSIPEIPQNPHNQVISKGLATQLLLTTEIVQQIVCKYKKEGGGQWRALRDSTIWGDLNVTRAHLKVTHPLRKEGVSPHNKVGINTHPPHFFQQAGVPYRIVGTLNV
jgi:hypothetical protein